MVGDVCLFAYSIVQLSHEKVERTVCTRLIVFSEAELPKWWWAEPSQPKSSTPPPADSFKARNEQHDKELNKAQTSTTRIQSFEGM
jgi:hypothetical protein